jgi:uncharacterized membrane protein YhaH (DUF805 family)
VKTVLNSISRTFDFKGRSSRQELIFYILFLVIQSCILILSEEIKAGRILTIIGSIFRGSHTLSNIQNVLIGVLFISFIPLICLLIRRLHDINLSILFIGIPAVILYGIRSYIDRSNIKAESESYYDIKKMEFIDGTNNYLNNTQIIIIIIIVLIFLCLKGSDGDNKYGEWIKPD